MNSHRTAFFTAVALAGFAVSLVLAGCGPQPGAPGAEPSVTVSKPADRQAVPAVPPSSAHPPSSTANTAAPPSHVPAPPVKDATPALETFTFPDGHISFAYPHAWSVRTVLPPGGLPGVEVVVADAAGNDLLSLSNGVTAGCTGGPVSRRVFDQAPVPGMTAPDGTVPSFGFAVDTVGKADAYFMGLTDSRSLKEGGGATAWCNLVATANGGLFTRVLFNDPAFPGRAAAEAWLATDQYVQLKALLLSLNYA